MKKKQKVLISLVYQDNKRGSYDGFVSLNGQPFRFANFSEEEALNKLKTDTEWLCEDIIKNIKEKEMYDNNRQIWKESNFK